MQHCQSSVIIIVILTVLTARNTNLRYVRVYIIVLVTVSVFSCIGSNCIVLKRRN